MFHWIYMCNLKRGNYWLCLFSLAFVWLVIFCMCTSIWGYIVMHSAHVTDINLNVRGWQESFATWHQSIDCTWQSLLENASSTKSLWTSSWSKWKSKGKVQALSSDHLRTYKNNHKFLQASKGKNVLFYSIIILHVHMYVLCRHCDIGQSVKMTIMKW